MRTEPTAYMTLAEAADFLRCSPRTLKRYLQAGRVPFTRIGRRYLFRAEELVANVSGRRLAKASLDEVLV